MKTAVTTLAVCVAALLTLGLVMLYSATMSSVAPRSGGAYYGTSLLKSQLCWCALGLVACVVAATLDYRKLKPWVWPIFGVTLLLLVGLLVLPKPFVTPINGARRWFSLPGFSLQVSELAKVALILALAWYCDRHQRQMTGWTRGVLWPGVIILSVLGLIFVEPDRGTTILLAAVSGSLLLLAGVSWRHFLPPVGVGLAALVVSLLADPMRMKRIFSWLYLEENRQGVGYQAYQSMIALGSGGWFGLGLGNSRQKLGFLPEHHTDFIFAIIGEELGLVATLGVVTAFVLIVCCGIYIATCARDTFGTMIAAGVTFLVGFQACINIGVVTSALPNKGLALPFISYGGSSLLVMMTGVGLLFSVARQARASEARPANPFATGELSPAPTS